MPGPDSVTTLLANAIDSQANSPALLAWFGCLCGIYVFGRGLTLVRPKRRIQHPATSVSVTPIRQASPGLLEVCGTTEGAPTLTAAISGKPCFYYRAVVWRLEEAAQGDAWSKANEETKCQPFLLNDGTGRILVDPNGAEIDLHRDTYEEYGKTLLATHTDIPGGLEDLLARLEVDTSAALRVEEYVISPGSRFFVNGTVTSNLDLDVTGSPLPPVLPPGKAGSLSHTSPAAKASGKTAPLAGSEITQQNIQQPKIIRLSPEPRTLPAAEMTMQSRLAAALTRSRMTQSKGDSAVTVEEPIVEEQMQEPDDTPPLPEAPKSLPPPFIVRATDGAPFTISEGNPADAAASSRGTAFALLVVGPLITLGSAYYLLMNFGWL